jgi:hypothetical protein
VSIGYGVAKTIKGTSKVNDPDCWVRQEFSLRHLVSTFKPSTCILLIYISSYDVASTTIWPALMLGLRVLRQRDVPVHGVPPAPADDA